jgi:hypothetical protein
MSSMSSVSSKLNVSLVSKWMIAAGVCASLAACATEAPTAPETVVPRLTANSLTPGQLANGTLTTVQLDATSAAAMGATADARETLSYAVNCALSSSQSITFTVDGTSYTYAGALGLASSWTSAALSSDDAGWVSACVLSRVNLTGTAVSISDRGSNAALASTSSEVASWDLEEGAFWGNTFVDLGAIAGLACEGTDQAADDSRGDLPARQCARPDGASSTTACGFTYAGACATACSAASPYAGCAAPGGAPSANVITTFVLSAP